MNIRLVRNITVRWIMVKSTSIKNSLDHEAKDESQTAQVDLVNYKAVQLK